MEYKKYRRPLRSIDTGFADWLIQRTSFSTSMNLKRIPLVFFRKPNGLSGPVYQIAVKKNIQTILHPLIRVTVQLDAFYKSFQIYVQHLVKGGSHVDSILMHSTNWLSLSALFKNLHTEQSTKQKIQTRLYPFHGIPYSDKKNSPGLEIKQEGSGKIQSTAFLGRLESYFRQARLKLGSRLASHNMKNGLLAYESTILRTFAADKIRGLFLKQNDPMIAFEGVDSPDRSRGLVLKQNDSTIAFERVDPPDRNRKLVLKHNNPYSEFEWVNATEKPECNGRAARAFNGRNIFYAFRDPEKIFRRVKCLKEMSLKIVQSDSKALGGTRLRWHDPEAATGKMILKAPTRTKEAVDLQSPFRFPPEMKLAIPSIPETPVHDNRLKKIENELKAPASSRQATPAVELDINKITDKVFDEIQRKIRISRERRGL